MGGTNISLIQVNVEAELVSSSCKTNARFSTSPTDNATYHSSKGAFEPLILCPIY